ncbi:hypothetical protein PG988_015568 [Apiospora saccharicola]
MGCDTYWMDTACIPHGHVLRREAIEQINPVFEGARATLIYDSDLMALDVSGLQAQNESSPDRLKILETLLVTLLVSNWNVRAWTLLEAARGRMNILLLCANNAVVSLIEALETVSRLGAIEIAVLYLTSEQLFASLNQGRARMTLETSSALLSRRHASRDGDITVIWSRLFGDIPFETPESICGALMKRPRDIIFNCGFLMTSAPRIQGIRGLSWAPQKPALIGMADEQPGGQQAHLGESFAEINVCTMQGKGLSWWCCAHRFDCATSARKAGQLRDIAISYLEGSGKSALLVPAFVRPPQGTFLPAMFKGNGGGTIVAVCRLTSMFTAEWRGVYDWRQPEPIPKLIAECIFLHRNRTIVRAAVLRLDQRMGPPV